MGFLFPSSPEVLWVGDPWGGRTPGAGLPLAVSLGTRAAWGLVAAGSRCR